MDEAEILGRFFMGQNSNDIPNREKINKIYQKEILKLFSSDPNASYLGSSNSILQEAAYHVSRSLYTHNGMLILAPPGSGKTRTALMVYLALLDCFKGTMNPSLNQSSVSLITYNPKVFATELEKNPIYKKYMVGLNANLEETNFNTYGYKTLALSIFSNYGDQKEKDLLANQSRWNDDLEKMVEKELITINESFVKSFINCSVMIGDEIHEAYTKGKLNYMGLAISLLRYRNPHLRFIAMSATPLRSNFLELIPLSSLILDSHRDYAVTNKTTSPKDIKGFDKLIIEVASRTFFINPPQGKFFPTVSIEGGTLECVSDPNDKEFIGINFVKCPLKPSQKTDLTIEERGIQYFKVYEHCAIPPHVSHGVQLTNISREHLHLWYKDTNEIIESSSKIAMLHEIMVTKGVMAQRGGLVIYTDLNIFPYAMLVIHYMESLGIREYNKGVRSQVCSKCCGPHVKNADHVFAPAYYAVLNSNMNSTDIQAILDVYNSPENHDSKLIKFIIGSRLMVVSINLNNTGSMIIYRMPQNTTDLIQLMGRIFRSMIITDPLMDPHVKFFMLLVTKDNGEDTLEIIREKRKAIEWKVIQNIVKEIAANSINNHMVVPTSQLPLYQDKGDPVIKDQLHLPSKNMAEYLLYPPEFSPTSNSDRKPGGEIALELTRELRVSLAILLIKSILLVNNHVRLKQIYNLAARGIDFYFFNTSSLTESDINIAVMTLHTIGQQTIGMRVLTSVENRLKDLKDAYMSNIIMSVTSPWLITPDGHVKQIVVSKDSLVATDYTIDTVNPRALNFISHVRMGECNKVKTPPYKITTNTLIDSILESIEDCIKMDLPPLAIFYDVIETSKLDRLLEGIIRGGYKSYKKNPLYHKLCELFNVIGLLPDKNRGVLATGINFKEDWPVAYIWGKYYYWDGQKRVQVNMEPHEPSYNKDVCLQIKVQGNYCKIYFFHNVKIINADRRHDHRGRSINYLSTPNLRKYLNESEGVMHDKVKEILKETPKRSQYRKDLQDKIVIEFYKYALDHPCEDIVRFYWGRPGAKVSNWRTDNSVKEQDDLIDGLDEEIAGLGLNDEDCEDYEDFEDCQESIGCGGPCCRDRANGFVDGLVIGNRVRIWDQPLVVSI